MPIRNSKLLEIVGWVGVNLRVDSTDLQNHDMAAASNIDLHSRIAVAAQRQGKQKLFLSGTDTRWSVTDGGDELRKLDGLVQRLTRDRGEDDMKPLGLHRWEDRLLAGLAIVSDDAGPKGTYGWEVDYHGAQPQPLPDRNIRKLFHRSTTRYQAAGQRVYRDQKHIQDYRKLDCSAQLITGMLNYRPLLDNVEWTFIADRGQMLKDDGTVTRRWGIAPPVGEMSQGIFSNTADAQYALTYIRYTDEIARKVAHESNPTNCALASLVLGETIAIGHIGLIPHPEDPQVNGIGIYRSLTEGGTPLLVRRIPIPSSPSYSVTFGWEAVLYREKVALPAAWFAEDYDNRQLTTGDELRFQHALPSTGTQATVDFADKSGTIPAYTLLLPPIFMGTQQWEPGYAAPSTLPWVQAPEGSPPIFVLTPDTPSYNRFNFIQNSEDVPQDGTLPDHAIHGRHGTYRWEINDGYVTTRQTLRWAYGDITQTGALGAAVATDNDLPPASHYVAEHLGFTFLFGDDENEHLLYWSKRFQPESWPAANFIEVGSPTSPSRGLASIAGLLGIFTADTKYRITGSDSQSFVYQEALSSRGCPAPGTIVACERGIIFAAFDGVWQTTLTSPDEELSTNILPLFMDREVNGMKPIDWDYAIYMAAEYHKGRYYLSYVSKGSSEVDTVAVYSFDTQQWSFYALDARSFRWEDSRNILSYGATDGHLYQIEAGATDDDGLTIPFSFRTKDFGVYAKEQVSGNFIRVLWLFLKLDLEIANGSATVSVYSNDVLAYTTTVTGDRKAGLLHLPENTWGTKCRIEVSGEAKGPVLAHGLSMAYLPLEHD